MSREPTEQIYYVIERSSDIVEQPLGQSSYGIGHAIGQSLRGMSRALHQSLDRMKRTLGRSYIRIGQSSRLVGENIQRVRERFQSARIRAESGGAGCESCRAIAEISIVIVVTGRTRVEIVRARDESGRAERGRESAERGRERALPIHAMAALDHYIEEPVLIIGHNDGSSMQRVTSRPALPEPPGLTLSELQILPTAVHNRDRISDGESASSDVRCSICLKDFETGDKKLILPCVHNFHIKCCDKWLRMNATCPVCRYLIK